MTETGAYDGGQGEQLALVRTRVRASGPKPPTPAATERPVARVAVDVSLPHLDRPFDYLVPETMAESAQPGVRVRVRFAGQLVDGFLLDRVASSEHLGRLAPLHKVVSPEPVLSAPVAQLARAVADRYAGTLADVLRLAVPPRHARAEAEPARETEAVRRDTVPVSLWARYDQGPAFVEALRAGHAPRAVWTALPGAAWPAELAEAVAATLAGGRGALVVVPDQRDVDRVDAALRDLLGDGHHVALAAELGPAERYRRWLAVRRGTVRAVVGTRAAMFAPVADLGLAAVWDDGDDLHAEPHAPYPHVREVLGLRAVQETAGLLVGGFARTAEAAQLVATGWARAVAADRTDVRRAAPAVRVAGDDAELARDAAARTARLPSLAWRTAHDALSRGPVLVQVPRSGYLPSLACADCRAPARCGACHGPLAASAGSRPPACTWCGVVAAAWECPHCGARRTRAVVVGATRTAEELGRAFPQVPVRSSGGAAVLARVGAEPALVVATPGAEPVAEEGYAAALLLDGWALLSRPGLRAGEEALRRWMAAAALVRPGPEGGRVVLLADPASRAAQALVRWDPATFADRELSERVTLRLPPAARLVSLTGRPDPLRRLLAAAALPAGAEVLGPVPAPLVRAAQARAEAATGQDADEQPERLIVRVPRGAGRDLALALRAAAGVRSAHKEPGPVRIQVDPLEIA